MKMEKNYVYSIQIMAKTINKTQINKTGPGPLWRKWYTIIKEYESVSIESPWGMSKMEEPTSNNSQDIFEKHK